VTDVDRIDFESSNPVERSERIHEAEKIRGDRRRQRAERRAERKKRDRKPEDADREEKGAVEEVGNNLDIEA
jgi:hypothetical protein